MARLWSSCADLDTKFKNTNNKKYCLTMFSYHQEITHIGHWYNYGPADTFARFLKLKGYNVFQPQALMHLDYLLKIML